MVGAVWILAAAVAAVAAAGTSEALGGDAGGPLRVARTEAASRIAPRIVPKIIEVSPQRRSRSTGPSAAERERLLAEFPESLVERLWIRDWLDLELAFQDGRVIDIASDPAGAGFVLRLEGASRIAELENDEIKQRLLCRLAKPAAGLLYRLAWRLRLIEGEAYEPLEITSLVRTWDYQIRLAAVNPNADGTREGMPPTHVLGLAFDIARSPLSAERERRLEGVLEEFAVAGELAFYKEGAGNDTYHVMALPSAEEVLLGYYDRHVVAAEKKALANLRHRYLPESPCVMFGAALEPYSAECQCELPVEATASIEAGG